MPVTIKKKKTVKTIRTKRPSQAAKEGAEKKEAKPAEPAQAAPAPAQAQTTPPVAVQPEGKAHNYAIDVTIALVALLVFVVLIFVQVSEMSYYSAYPNVWPTPAGGAPVSPPADNSQGTPPTSGTP